MNKLVRMLRYDWPLHFALLLTNWLPDNVPFLRLRGWLARPFFGACGPNLRLGRNLIFYNPAAIFLGADIYIAPGCWFMAGDPIRVGDQVLFGPYCAVVSSEHTFLQDSFRFGKPVHAPIQIDKGCWIAAHVVITAGCMIGEQSLVAAGAVVTQNIPPGVLAGGLPARVIHRNGDE